MLFGLLLAAAAPVPDRPPLSAVNDLATAPQAWERFRFPDSPTAEAALRFNARFAENVGKEYDLWPERFSPIFDVTLEENTALRCPWNALAWAQWQTRSEWQRRLDLKRLRELIGEEAWNAGELPPCVPLWRYRDLR